MVVDSASEPAKAQAYTPAPAPSPALVEAAASGHAGTASVTLDGVGYQATWAPLPSTGWTLATLVSDESDVL